MGRDFGSCDDDVVMAEQDYKPIETLPDLLGYTMALQHRHR
jgi:hypothetical protein